MPLGALFTTINGEPIIDIPSGDMFLDFRNGTATDSAGTITLMNTNLDYYNLNQCNSFSIFASDADTGINIGNALTISDHQLTHTINSYAFDQIRLSIPANSTPDATNQVMFVASTNLEMNYIFNNFAHFKGEYNLTTTNTFTTYVGHHVGAYDQFHYIISNTDGSNSLNVKVQFSENGTDWFDAQGYTAAAGVTVAAGSYDSFSSENTHHFYRVQLQSTSSGNHATFDIFWNYVSLNN
jgi:hypothetical protein